MTSLHHPCVMLLSLLNSLANIIVSLGEVGYLVVIIFVFAFGLVCKPGLHTVHMYTALGVSKFSTTRSTVLSNLFRSSLALPDLPIFLIVLLTSCTGTPGQARPGHSFHLHSPHMVYHNVLVAKWIRSFADMEEKLPVCSRVIS